MEPFRPLIQTPLRPVAYGTMQWGGTADLAAARAMFDACIAKGITHFDTAVGYTDGQSEVILGQLAAACRETVFIATKVGYQGGCSARNITAQFDRSQTQLKMDYVDLLYLHRFDDETPLEETFEAMVTLQSSGKIRHIGVSNYAAWQVMKAQAVCQRLGTRIDALQPMYSLVKRQAEVELMPMAADQDIQVIPYSPLGGGLLTGKYASGGTGRLSTDKRYAARYAPKPMHEAAAQLAAIARQTGHHPATLAIAWVAAQPGRPWPILSARSLKQLVPSLAATDLTLTADLIDQLSSIFPAPPPATDRLEEA